MLKRLMVFLVVWSGSAQASSLVVTCMGQGSAPAVSAWVQRDPDAAVNPLATAQVWCRDDDAGAFVCPCATRKPKPTACIVAVVAPPEIDEPAPYAVACGYTDREHAKPLFGPWQKVQVPR